jgi:hypothetical protein
MTDITEAKPIALATIPPEALRAARNAYFKATHLSWQGAVDAACHAMLVAWPDSILMPRELILPLSTENTDAEA